MTALPHRGQGDEQSPGRPARGGWQTLQRTWPQSQRRSLLGIECAKRWGQRGPSRARQFLNSFQLTVASPKFPEVTLTSLSTAQGKSRGQMTEFDLMYPLHPWQGSRGADRRKIFPGRWEWGRRWQLTLEP